VPGGNGATRKGRVGRLWVGTTQTNRFSDFASFLMCLAARPLRRRELPCRALCKKPEVCHLVDGSMPQAEQFIKAWNASPSFDEAVAHLSKLAGWPMNPAAAYRRAYRYRSAGLDVKSFHSSGALEPTQTVSKKQLEVYQFIIAYVAERGYQPTIAEVAAKLEVDPKAVHDRLRLLQRKGVLTMTGKERAIILHFVKFPPRYDGPAWGENERPESPDPRWPIHSTVLETIQEVVGQKRHTSSEIPEGTGHPGPAAGE
jgi:hypothetical protein